MLVSSLWDATQKELKGFSVGFTEKRGLRDATQKELKDLRAGGAGETAGGEDATQKELKGRGGFPHRSAGEVRTMMQLRKN